MCAHSSMNSACGAQKHSVIWRWSYRQLWASWKQVFGTRLGSSAREASAFNCWTVSPATHLTFTMGSGNQSQAFRLAQQMLFTHSDDAFLKSLTVEPLDFFSCFVKRLFMRLILQSFQFLHLCRGYLYLEKVWVPQCIDLFSWTMTIILYVDMCVNDLAYKKPGSLYKLFLHTDSERQQNRRLVKWFFCVSMWDRKTLKLTSTCINQSTQSMCTLCVYLCRRRILFMSVYTITLPLFIIGWNASGRNHSQDLLAYLSQFKGSKP